MYVSFDELDNKARVWIYQSNRSLQPEEVNWLQKNAEVFAEKWAAHGSGLLASAKVLHNQFLVLAVDESNHGASGCSIDSSVAFVKQAQQELGVDFFDRSKVAFQLNEAIELIPLTELKNKIAEGLISNDLPTFNNLVATKKDMMESWIAPAKETWLERYF